MNLLDKAIAWVSPEAGLKRARARAATDVLLSYEGVRDPRRAGGWSPKGTSGNAEMGPAIGKLRDNAEDLTRNNAFATRAARRWCRRVVGYGITPQADTGNDVLNAAIDAQWKIWVTRCFSDVRLNMYAGQRMIVRTAFVRGECLIRIWDRSMADGLPIPLQLQIIEPDYIDTNKTGKLESGFIIHGVQFDSIGRIQGYWLFGEHPGDPVSTSRRGSLQSQFVPAENIIHHVPLERPGDVRGVSRFAPVIAKLRDIDETADAVLMRRKIEACLAMFVGQEEAENGATLGPVTDSSGQPIERFSPGMIVYGKPGQAPEFFSPSSTGDYASHKKIELKEVAAGLDIPYVIIGDDLSDVNYSSFRGGAIDERDAVDEYRWLWFLPQVMDRIWQRFIDKLVAIGAIDEAAYGVKWNPPPFDVLDRKAEAEADDLELRIGKKTWPQLVGDQGVDPQKQIADIEKWKPRLEAAGVDFGAQQPTQ